MVIKKKSIGKREEEYRKEGGKRNYNKAYIFTIYKEPVKKSDRLRKELNRKKRTKWYLKRQEKKKERERKKRRQTEGKSKRNRKREYNE